jgi:DNA-binding LacI/PurR family transcriptional regulator
VFALQRRERLMDELRAHGSVAVRDIAVLLNVSELTIRRDINTLAQQGLVTRVHGGATLRSSIEPNLGSAVGSAGVTRYTLGMVVPSLDYYWPQIINGARAAATQAQSRLLLRGSTYDVRDDRKQVQALVNTPGVHGGATQSSSNEPNQASTVVGAGVTRYTLGMVVTSLDYYWPQIINGARAAATQAQSRLLLRGSTYDVRDNRKQVQALVNTPGVHGIIAAPDTAGAAGRDLLRWLDGLSVPVVLAERRAPESVPVQRLESVATDHAYGARRAVRHLHGAGHERIGLLAEPHSPTTAQVRRGWQEAIETLGLPADVVNTDAVSFNSKDREKVMDEIIAQCTATGTTALVILSDPQAVAFEQHCLDRGIRVPDDLAIVAYDDEVAHLGDPAVTAVRPPKQYVGREAVELLVARLESGRRRPIHRIELNPELIVRESSIKDAQGE